MNGEIPRIGNPLPARSAKLGPVQRRNSDRITSPALPVQTVLGQQAKRSDENETIQGIAATWSHSFHRRYSAENVQCTTASERAIDGMRVNSLQPNQGCIMLPVSVYWYRPMPPAICRSVLSRYACRRGDSRTRDGTKGCRGRGCVRSFRAISRG